MSSSVPHGWAFTTIGEVCDRPTYGWTTRARSEGRTLHFLRTTDISSGVIDWPSVPYCDEEPADPEKYALRPGDIVISRAGSVGLSALIGQSPPAVFASYLVRFRPTPVIDSRYLRWYLQSDGYWQQISVAAVGIALRNVNARKLAAVRLPLPPLTEQRRIVAALEEYLSDLEIAVAALRHARTCVDRYRLSVIDAAASGTLCGAAAGGPWETTTLGELAALVTSGSRGWAAHYAERGPLFIRAQDINTDTLRLADAAHVCPPAGAEGERTRVRAHDLLVTITGANVARTARVDREIGEAYVSQHVGLVRLKEPDLSDFLHLWIIAHSHGRRFLEAAAYGAGKPGLNLSQLRALPVRVPPRSERRLIVHEVERRLAVAERTEGDIELQLNKSASMRRSILKAALDGRLVAHDRDGRGAAVRLNRVQLAPSSAVEANA